MNMIQKKDNKAETKAKCKRNSDFCAKSPFTSHSKWFS